MAKAITTEEWLPGDPRLPRKHHELGAGALYVKLQYNMNVPASRDEYEMVKFMGDDGEWSIGYDCSGKKGKAVKNPKTGYRHIKDLTLYEVSSVLAGAAPHTGTLAVKGDEAVREVKSLFGTYAASADGEVLDLARFPVEVKDAWDLYNEAVDLADAAFEVKDGTTDLEAKVSEAWDALAAAVETADAEGTWGTKAYDDEDEEDEEDEDYEEMSVAAKKRRKRKSEFTAGEEDDEEDKAFITETGISAAGRARRGARGRSQAYNPDAVDADRDMIVQEGTPFTPGQDPVAQARQTDQQLQGLERHVDEREARARARRLSERNAQNAAYPEETRLEADKRKLEKLASSERFGSRAYRGYMDRIAEIDVQLRHAIEGRNKPRPKTPDFDDDDAGGTGAIVMFSDEGDDEMVDRGFKPVYRKAPGYDHGFNVYDGVAHLYSRFGLVVQASDGTWWASDGMHQERGFRSRKQATDALFKIRAGKPVLDPPRAPGGRPTDAELADTNARLAALGRVQDVGADEMIARSGQVLEGGRGISPGEEAGLQNLVSPTRLAELRTGDPIYDALIAEGIDSTSDRAEVAKALTDDYADAGPKATPANIAEALNTDAVRGAINTYNSFNPDAEDDTKKGSDDYPDYGRMRTSGDAIVADVQARAEALAAASPKSSVGQVLNAAYHSFGRDEGPGSAPGSHRGGKQSNRSMLALQAMEINKRVEKDRAVERSREKDLARARKNPELIDALRTALDLPTDPEDEGGLFHRYSDAEIAAAGLLKYHKAGAKPASPTRSPTPCRCSPRKVRSRRGGAVTTTATASRNSTNWAQWPRRCTRSCPRRRCRRCCSRPATSSWRPARCATPPTWAKGGPEPSATSPGRRTSAAAAASR